ncbi:hypothetical protein DF133_13225 [Burkholderia cenocepacia]|nr:hypothetical protein DF133_13225 [Burkholderia cenocepacia]
MSTTNTLHACEWIALTALLTLHQHSKQTALRRLLLLLLLSRHLIAALLQQAINVRVVTASLCLLIQLGKLLSIRLIRCILRLLDAHVIG